MKIFTIVKPETVGTLVQHQGSSIHPDNPILQRIAAEEIAEWIFKNMPAAFVEKMERTFIQHRAEREQDLGIALGKDPHTRYLLQKV